MIYLDKNGWPVEVIKNKKIKNFFRLLIHTRKVKRGTQVDYKVYRKINWALVLQGLFSYKATYERLERDDLLKEYELHEYEVIKEAIEELEKGNFLLICAQDLTNEIEDGGKR